MKSFTVELWSKIFGALSWISLFRVVCSLSSAARRSYRFVDAWVLGNLLLSMLLLVSCSHSAVRWWEIIAIGYGAIRVFEIVIYQINVVLFDAYRAKRRGARPVIRSFRRIVILLLQNYVEIILWFALFYRNTTGAFETGGVSLNSFLMSFNLSFATMTSFGHTSIHPRGDTLGNLLILAQSVIALVMALLVLQRFISAIPVSETLDEFEE